MRSSSYPTHQQIELRAYQLWEQRGCPWGTPDNDWFSAEHDLSNVEPENPLSAAARQIGSAIGTVVSILSAATESDIAKPA
jgi:hypothetical protein